MIFPETFPGVWWRLNRSPSGTLGSTESYELAGLTIKEINFGFYHLSWWSVASLQAVTRINEFCTGAAIVTYFLEEI